MRPPAPVPRTRLRSILCSRAILRTSGESGPGASRRGLGGRRRRGCGRRNRLRRRRRAPDGLFGGRRGAAWRRRRLSAMRATTVLIAHRLAFLHQHFRQRAGRGRRNLGIHLVGGDLEQRLVALHALAGLLEPLGQRAFDNALAHLGHHYVGHVSSLFRPRGRRPSPHSISQSKTRAEVRGQLPETSSSVARTPSCAMEVTGLVSPQGTMYWK